MKKNSKNINTTCLVKSNAEVNLFTLVIGAENKKLIS